MRCQVDKLLGQQIISIGHSSTTAKEINLEIKIRDLNELQKLTLSRKYPVKIKIITDTADRIVGAQVITKKYGSQYSYELRNAILENKSFNEFIKEWKPPLEKVVGFIRDKKEASLVGKDIKDIGLVKY